MQDSDALLVSMLTRVPSPARRLRQIRAELAYHQIRVYPFDTEENDDEERQLNGAIRVRRLLVNPGRARPPLTGLVLLAQNMMPFAVVGSERNVIVDGKPVRGRKNRWGVVNVENEAHCDFNYLRNFLTRYARAARISHPSHRNCS